VVRTVSLLALVAAGIGVLTLGASAPGAATQACPPTSGHTLLANADARLYTARGALSGCAAPRNEVITLAFAETFYGRR